MEKNLKQLFQEWQELNSEVAKSLGNFEFDSIKKVREKQRKIEDQIYLILLKSASRDIKKILPETCGEMEMGYEISSNTFYFLMEDPEQIDKDKINILAITIDSNKNVNTVKNFQSSEID